MTPTIHLPRNGLSTPPVGGSGTPTNRMVGPMGLFDKFLRAGEGRKVKALADLVPDINALEPEMQALSDSDLQGKTAEFRQRLDNGEPLDELLIEAFAATREAAFRVIGQRHYDVQLMGGAALHFGWVAEMKTGEGKTLVSTLPVYLNALAGKGVHIITVNDYLATRDAETMGQIHKRLGLSIGLVIPGINDPAEKRAQYACDITYGTNNEFGFDYLRDNMAMSRAEQVQRGRSYCIVDEIDSILIDEARTPLIISGRVADAAKVYYQFASIVRGLKNELHYDVDEEKRTVAPTEEGVEAVERALGVDNMYDEVSQNLVHQLQAALRAKELFKRDKDYVVQQGEVKIVDEFTGRILDGRRWSEGLHQAVEAKEGVRVQEENQTLATVTLQNYFRMYDKLAGMTGTALTEATEFQKIYELGVVQIPTNRDMVRADKNDQVYKTKDGKWSAVEREIAARHEKGQPVLIGTISVEVSELLGERLRLRGIPHAVLNAKPEHAEREGEIIAEAGRPGAVTIATNMAGRGVDIKLGGNAEHQTRLELAKLGLSPGDPDYDSTFADILPKLETKIEEDREKVVEAGGLFICGTERHESRRIDNQLRGRSGRQGDPGESRFFLSAEDDLVRLFAGDRIYKILDRLGTTDEEGNEEPIEAGILSKQIEKAQRRVEEQNFLIRKRVLEYDDVMNEQRRVVYAYRDEILEGRDMGGAARDEISQVIGRMVDDYTGSDFVEDWDIDGLATALQDVFPADIVSDEERLSKHPDRNELTDGLITEALELYDRREAELGDELIRALERYLLLQIIDQRWREHLYDMDYLREGIHLRGFAQIDPLVAYKNEAFTLFQDLMNSIWNDFARMVYNVEVQIEGENGGGGETAALPDPGRGGRLGVHEYGGGTHDHQQDFGGAADAGDGPEDAGEPE